MTAMFDVHDEPNCRRCIHFIPTRGDINWGSGICALGETFAGGRRLKHWYLCPSGNYKPNEKQIAQEQMEYDKAMRSGLLRRARYVVYGLRSAAEWWAQAACMERYSLGVAAEDFKSGFMAFARLVCYYDGRVPR